jgi:RHS repeat-associated protein
MHQGGFNILPSFQNSRTDASYDSYIKLIDLRSRMYSPETGRFTSKDSWLGDYNRAFSLNRWNYVEGNPINRTDRSGKCWYGDVSTGEIKTAPYTCAAAHSINSTIRRFVFQTPKKGVKGYLSEVLNNRT